MLIFIGGQVGENLSRSIVKTNLKGFIGRGYNLMKSDRSKAIFAALKIYQSLWLIPAI